MVPVQASSRQVTSGCAGSTTRNWPVVRPVQAPEAVRLVVVPSGAVATTVGTPVGGATSRSLGLPFTVNVSVTVTGVLRRTWMSAIYPLHRPLIDAIGVPDYGECPTCDTLGSAEVVERHALLGDGAGSDGVVVDQGSEGVGDGDVAATGEVGGVEPHRRRRWGGEGLGGQRPATGDPVGGVGDFVAGDPGAGVVAGRADHGVLVGGDGVVEQGGVDDVGVQAGEAGPGGLVGGDHPLPEDFAVGPGHLLLAPLLVDPGWGGLLAEPLGFGLGGGQGFLDAVEFALDGLDGGFGLFGFGVGEAATVVGFLLGGHPWADGDLAVVAHLVLSPGSCQGGVHGHVVAVVSGHIHGHDRPAIPVDLDVFAAHVVAAFDGFDLGAGAGRDHRGSQPLEATAGVEAGMRLGLVGDVGEGAVGAHPALFRAQHHGHGRHSCHGYRAGSLIETALNSS